MHTKNKNPSTSLPPPDDAEQFRPPVTRWDLPAPRLKGVIFKGPITKITTVSTPIRPKKHT